MFGLGAQELFIILVIVVLLFGATQLPKLGKAIGEFTREFKAGMKDIENKENKEVAQNNQTQTQTQTSNSQKPSD